MEMAISARRSCTSSSAPLPTENQGGSNEKVHGPWTLFVLILAAMALTACATSSGMKMDAAPSTGSAVDLRIALRYLWDDHQTWTSSYIVYAMSGLEGRSRWARV